MIIGEIRRYLRDNSSMRISRSLKDTAYHAMQVKEELIAEQGVEPTVEMIAARLNICREEVVTALESIVDPISLYEPVYSDGSDTVYVMDQVGDKTGERGWLDVMLIKDAMRSLPEREKNILQLRFFEGKTQTEVAGCIGISQAQVSRLEKGAIDFVKNSIE